MLKIRKTANEIIDSVARVKESANEAINNITQAKDSFIQKGKDFFASYEEKQKKILEEFIHDVQNDFPNRINLLVQTYIYYQDNEIIVYDLENNPQYKIKGKGPKLRLLDLRGREIGMVVREKTGNRGVVPVKSSLFSSARKPIPVQFDFSCGSRIIGHMKSDFKYYQESAFSLTAKNNWSYSMEFEKWHFKRWDIEGNPPRSLFRVYDEEDVNIITYTGKTNKTNNELTHSVISITDKKYELMAMLIYLALAMEEAIWHARTAPWELPSG
ncbi:MAG: hypothetical protein IKE94_06145 [Aeriscardovia sp.]|nr:hypothetical protein [Aeriscardovia sp.]